MGPNSWVGRIFFLGKFSGMRDEGWFGGLDVLDKKGRCLSEFEVWRWVWVEMIFFGVIYFLWQILDLDFHRKSA